MIGTENQNSTPCRSHAMRLRIERSTASLLPAWRWRQTFVRQIDARPSDTVADVGCGTGELTVMLKLYSPAACVFGLDPSPNALERAERRSCIAGAMVHFVHATLDDVAEKLATRRPTQVSVSRVLHRLPPISKKRLLEAAFDALPRGGQLHIADVGWHRPSNSMKTVTLMRDAGFVQCNETSVIPTFTGVISLYRGVKS